MGQLRRLLAYTIPYRGLLVVGMVSVAVAGIVGAVRRPTQRTAATRLVNAFLIALVLFVLAADAYWLLAL